MNKKIFYVVLVVMFAVSVSGYTVSPQYKPEISYGYTDTIQERVNITGGHYEKDGNTYLFDVGIIDQSVSSRFGNGSPKDVDLIVELEPNNLTKLLNGNEQPFKDIRDGKHEDYENGTDYFNQHYYYEGGNISSTEFNDLGNELSSIPVYENGSLVKNVALKDKAKNVTAKAKFRDNERDVTVTIGSGSTVIAVSSGSDDSYDKFKPVNVTSVSGTPTVSKVQPVNLTCGDDLTDGTGVIEIDCANVNGVEDVDFTNSTDHRLNYEFESFNLDTGGYAMAWVYGDWVRDGTEQLRVHYGSGSTDEQDVTGTWDNIGQNTVMVQHLNESNYPTDDALDSTSNNNDGTVNGAVSTTGEFDGAASFDGDNDYIATPAMPDHANDHVVTATVNYDTDNGANTAIYAAYDGSNDIYEIGRNSANELFVRIGHIGGNEINSVIQTLNTGETYQIILHWDSSTETADVYVNGSLSGSPSATVADWTEGGNPDVGRRSDDSQYHDGFIDEVKVYNSKTINAEFAQADYDASPKTGQVFFSQQAAETGDSISPNISYNPSTISSGTYSRDWVLVNVTATDETSLSTVTEEFDGTNSSFNTNQGDYYWTNHTSLADGSYSFQAFAEDDAGNTNSTEERSVTLDTTPPSITIESPLNQTYGSSEVDLNVTSNETVDTWQYSLDSGSNTTFTPNTTLTGLSDGSHTVDVYANDSSGNTGSNSETFTVSTTTGNVEINSSVQINQSDNNVEINVTDQITLDYLTAYNDTTDFGNSNFTISGTTGDDIDIRLSFFNESVSTGKYAFNFTASTVDGNNVSFNFSNLTQNNLYRFYNDGSVYGQENASTGSIEFYRSSWSQGVFQSFDILHTADYFADIISQEIVRDFVNSISRLRFDLDSFSENDVDSFQGDGTKDTFTNNSLKVDVTLPVDSKYNITDFDGLTNPSRQINLTETDTGVVENSSYSHTLDSQKRKQTVSITSNSTKDIDYTLNLSTGEDFTGTINPDSKIEKTGSETNDFITNNTYDFSVDTNEVTLGFNYTGHFPLETDNTVGTSWTGIDTTGAISSPNNCRTTNNTAVDLSGNTKKNFSVEQDCNPGSKGNPTQTVNNASGSADERVWYNSTDMVINTNKTENTSVAIKADKSNLKNPDDRDGSSLQAFVEGKNDSSNNLTVEDTGSFFRITVGTSFQSSSLHTDDSSWSITYTLTGDSTVVTGGGGGGGTSPSTDDFTVFFGRANTSEGIETFNPEFGGTTVKNMSITNTVDQDLVAQISKGSGPICQYVSVRPTLNSDQWSSSGSYSVSGASVNNLGALQDEVVETQIRFQIPNKTTLEDVGITDYSCEFDTSVSYGVAEPLKVEASEGFNFFGLIGFLQEEFCLEVPTGSLANDLTSVDSDSVNICLPVWSWVLIGLIPLFLVYLGVRRNWF